MRETLGINLCLAALSKYLRNFIDPEKDVCNNKNQSVNEAIALYAEFQGGCRGSFVYEWITFCTWMRFFRQCMLHCT